MFEEDPEVLWKRYMGPLAEPKSYAQRGHDVLDRLREDLTERWAEHPEEPLTEAEINDVARMLSVWLQERWWQGVGRRRPAQEAEPLDEKL